MRWMFVFVALLVVADPALQAQSSRRQRRQQMMNVVPTTSVNTTVVREMPTSETAGPAVRQVESTTAASQGSDDALQEVNAERTKRGLRPFVTDSLLNQAALACAKQRASRQIHGHLPESDFHYLPSGGQANAAGCGALEPSWGWGTCCTYDNYTYAGAAWVMGSDGRRYMHLFVR